MDIMNLAAKISLDSKGFESGLRNSESLMKGFGDKISAWTVAKGQLLADFAKKAASAVGDFVKGSVQEGMNFDKAMSQVAATMGKSMSEMANEVGSAAIKVNGQTKSFTGNLEEFARFMGANTAFSATQAAEALNYMALAGYDTQKSMNMLPNVLNLAAAGAMDLARASDMVTDTQTAFGISEERTTQMIDEMAAAASNSNTSVSQLGDAFLVVGALAQDLSGGMVKLSDGTEVSTDNIQQMEIALGAMANAGIKGSEAGTHLRNMILKLSSPTKEGAKALKQMGVDVFDAEGNMKSLTDIFTDLSGAFKTMTKEEKLATISDLFNTRDTASVEALLKAVESGGWDQVTQAITNAQGAAQKMADTQLDNLAGDVTKWKSALGEAQIAISEKLSPTLRKFVQFGTQSLDRLTRAFKRGGLTSVFKTLDRVMLSAIDRLKTSESPIAQTFGKILANVRDWFNITKQAFTDFPAFIKSAWQKIKQNANSLGGLIFGKNDKGEVQWPTWDDVKDAAKKAWNKIKSTAITLGNEFGKLVFGTTEKGDVKWPTWEDVKQFAKDAWEKITSAASSLGNEFGKLVFGTTETGEVNWPTWEDVKDFALQAWEKIKEAAKSLGNEFGKIVFGTNEKGEVQWPTWEDVVVSAKLAWIKIRDGAKNIAKGALKLVFGSKEDGSVDFPTWNTVKAKATEIWEEIKAGASKLKGLVFGDAEQAGTVFDRISDAWNNLRSTIEGGAIKIATYFFGENADPQQIADAIKTIGDVLVALGAGIATYMAINSVIKLVDAIKVLFTLPSASPVALILAGIATAITLIAQNWESIEPILQEVGTWVDENLIQPFATFFEELKAWIKGAVDDIRRFLGLRVAGELTQGEADQLKFAYQSDKANGNNLYESGFVDALRSKLSEAGFEAEEVDTIINQIVNANDPAWVSAFIDSLTTAEGKAKALADILNGITGGSGITPYGAWASSYYGSHSHAKGGVIPYDNYIANLHRGEVVLTASQARQLQSKNNSSVDLSGLNDGIIAAIKAGLQDATVNSFLDGQLVSDTVSRVLASQLADRRYI